MNRRKFVKLAPLAAASGLVSSKRMFAQSRANNLNVSRLSVSLFSKHLQFLDYRETAEAAAKMGFDGLDLTVRPNGHVLPENARTDLPKAVKEARRAGLAVEMIATSITDADDPLSQAILQAAADLGIKNYRTGYVSFSDPVSWKSDLDRHKARFEKLARLNEKLGLHGCYQNHSGKHVGAYVTDIVYMLDGIDPRWLGCQYDIRHATVEGGTAWPTGLQSVRGAIRTIDLKDFIWEQRDGGWKPTHVPMEKGMVDFIQYFKMLHALKIHPIASLHAEYPLGGAEKGKRSISIPPEHVFAALERDLASVRRLWRESQSA